MASGIQRRKEKRRGKEHGSCPFSEPAVFVTKVAKKSEYQELSFVWQTKNLPIPEYILIPEYPKRTRLKFLYGRIVECSDKSKKSLLIRADCLESKVNSDRDLSIYFFRYPRASKRRLKFARHSSNVVFEEFVLSSLITSPLIKPLFTPGGWHELKWVY